MKSRDHFGTPMPLCMSVTQLKVSSTHLASTVGIPKIGIHPKAGHLNVCFSNGNTIQKLDTEVWLIAFLTIYGLALNGQITYLY